MLSFRSLLPSAMEGERTILSIPGLPLRLSSPIRPTTTHLRHPCCHSTDAAAAASPSHTTLSTLPEPLIQIHKAGVIACLRAPHMKTAVEAAQAALAGGVSVLEVVISTPGALEVIKVLRKDYPSVKLGDILHWFRGSEILYMPGAMTPTEIFSAYNAGAEAIKIYPVSALGGEKYISTLRKPFPTIPMIASQGITAGSIRNYINAGSLAVVLSDAIFDKEAMIKQDFDEIKRLAQLVTIEASVARKDKELGNKN